MYRIDRITTLERLMECRDAWETLVQKNAAGDIFLAFRFFATWVELQRDSGSPLVLLVTRAGEPVALVPLISVRSTVGGIPCRSLKSALPRSDFIAIPSEKEASIRAIVGHWEETAAEWDMIAFLGIPERSGTLMGIEAAVAASRTLGGFRTRPSSSEGYLSTVGGWEAYLQGRSVKFRKNVRYNLNRLERMGRVLFHTYSHPEDLDRGAKVLFDLEGRSWKVGEGELLAPCKRSLLLDLARDQSGGFGYEILVLELDGEPIAAIFSLEYRTRLYAFLTYYDQRFASVFPGRIVVTRWVERALSRAGIREASFVGSSDFIRSWTPLERTYRDCHIYNSRFLSRFLSWRDGKRAGGGLAP